MARNSVSDHCLSVMNAKRGAAANSPSAASLVPAYSSPPSKKEIDIRTNQNECTTSWSFSGCICYGNAATLDHSRSATKAPVKLPNCNEFGRRANPIFPIFTHTYTHAEPTDLSASKKPRSDAVGLLHAYHVMHQRRPTAHAHISRRNIIYNIKRCRIQSMSLVSTKPPSCGAHWSQRSISSGRVTATCRTQHRKRHTTQMFDARCHYNSTPRRLHSCTVERVAIAPQTFVDHITRQCATTQQSLSQSRCRLHIP
jgi:hypothetical protein